MSRKRRFFALALSITALIIAGIGAGCSKNTPTSTTQSPSPKTSTPAPTSTDISLPSKIFQIGETSDTAQVQVSNGDRFALAIPSNATTGFQWSASTVPSFLTSEGSKYAGAPTPAMPGAGGTQYLIFKATGTGTETMALAYARPNSTEAPARTVRVEVIAT